MLPVQDLAVETTGHLQSRSGARREQGTQGQPTLRGQQPKTDSAVDFTRRFTVSAATWKKQDKELHDGMQIGLTSCSNFWANTFRVLLTAAAYVLMQEMRTALVPNAPRPGASLDLARTFSKTRSSSHRLGASHRAALALLSVSLPR